MIFGPLLTKMSVESLLLTNTISITSPFTSEARNLGVAFDNNI